MITKFTVPNETLNKNELKSEERIYYRWEDSVFIDHAEASFAFQSTFKTSGEDGKTSWIQGAMPQVGGGKETQYKLVYAIEYAKYVKLVPRLAGLIEK